MARIDIDSLRASESSFWSSFDASQSSFWSAFESSMNNIFSTDNSPSTTPTTSVSDTTADPVPTSTSTDVISRQTPTVTPTSTTTTAIASGPSPSTPTSLHSSLAVSSLESSSFLSQSTSGVVSFSRSSFSSVASTILSPPPAERPVQTTPHGRGLAPGAIAGIVVAIVASAALLAAARWRRRRLARRRTSGDRNTGQAFVQRAALMDGDGVSTGPSIRLSSSSPSVQWSSQQPLSAAPVGSLELGSRALTTSGLARPLEGPQSMSTIATSGVPLFDHRVSLIRRPPTGASQRASAATVSRTDSTLVESTVLHLSQPPPTGAAGLAFWSRDIDVRHVHEQDGGVRLAGGPLGLGAGLEEDGITGDIKSVLPPPYSE